MYCRTCGNKVNDNAEVCVKCGCKPLIGKTYCQNCGAKTSPQQEMCTKCGVKLRTIATTAQKKKTIEKKGLKIVGNVIMAFGIIILLIMAINVILKILGMNYDYYLIHIIRSLIVGVPCIIVGNIIKKQSKSRK